MDAIVCALDLSPTSNQVVNWAVLFARLLNRPLVLFHAIHVPSDPWHPDLQNERGQALLRRQDGIQSEMSRLMDNANYPWQSEITVGDPAEAVAQYCKRHPVQWVITGSKGFKGVKRFVMGTVVERMARMLSCPMLVIRSTGDDIVDINRIAVCCDRSFSGQRLAEYGSVLADLTGAELHLLHALESATDPTFVDPANAPYGEAQQELLSRVKNYLLAMLPEKLQQNGRIQAHVAAGQAHDRIPGLLHHLACDMLLVGVKPRRALGQWITGSTTETVLRRVPTHVLVVPEDSKMVAVTDLEQVQPAHTGALRTAIIGDPIFLAHRTPDGHPENHHRLAPIYALIQDSQDSTAAMCEPRSASEADLALVHSPEYIRSVARTARMDSCQLSADTYTSADSYAAACKAAGGVMTAIDGVLNGNFRNAMVLARPPGHHAEISRASGFCLFNNVAVGARYARRTKGLRKVLIIDWDLHHGNGTQHIFEEDETVLYISSHQYPCFPGTGHYLEVGRGPGQGYTINLPLGKRWRDGDLLALYQRLVMPVAMAFNPDLVLVSAGFDIHKKDPLGSMRITEDGFAALTRMMMRLARRCCNDRLVLVLEGGYHPKAMASSIEAVLSELRGQTRTDLDRLLAKARNRRIEPVINRCAHNVGHLWRDII